MSNNCDGCDYNVDDPISMREFSLNDIKSLCSFKSDFVEETEDV